MTSNNKILVVGGLLAGVAVIYLFLKKQAANQTAYLNQPGLETQNGVTSQISGVLNSVTGGIAMGSGLFSSISSAFGSTTDSNDPGLESDDETDFEGMDYTMENSDPYQETDSLAFA